MKHLHRSLALTFLTALVHGPLGWSQDTPPVTQEAPAATGSPAEKPSPQRETKKIAAEDDSLEDTFEKKRFSLNVRNGEMREVLRIIAQRGGLEVRTEAAVSGKISVSLMNVTLAEALDQLAEENGLEYLIDGDRLTVKKIGIGFKKAGRFSGSSALARAPGSTENGPSISANLSSGSSGSLSTGVKEIPVRYAMASEVATRVQDLVTGDDRVVVDTLANSLIFQGSEVNFLKLQEVVKLLDRMPQQILIEAQIVETSRNFLQAFGLNWGATADPGFKETKAKFALVNSAPGPSSPNGAIRYVIGDMGGIPLDVRLTAAETNGDAKVISRPKVVTLNNTPANIQSGVSFNVKTLSALPVGGAAGGAGGGGGGSVGQTGGMATGGVATLNAGLTLNVTPTIMGKDLVKLNVQINNSQPDESQIVDGIPGIVNNAATTSVIVSEGRTAVIAGLVKNTGGRAVASVPFFANIPIVGALFRNSNVTDRNNELVIFITPQIVTPQQDLKPERAFGEPKLSAPSTEGAPGT